MPVTLRLAVVPRAVLLLLLLAALLATAVAGVTIGSRLGLFRAATTMPVFPTGNGLIAFDAAGDVWVVNPDGTERRQLTTGPALEHSPVWSRDGTRLAYWSQASATAPSSLIVVDPHGSNPVTIATDPGGRSPWSLDWSSDGKYVAYSLGSETDPTSERIFVAATDGSSLGAQVGDPDLTAWKPQWSPDGSQLAFAASRAGADQGIYQMASDGTGVHKLSQVVDSDQYAFFTLDWSPDGKTILTNAASQVRAIAADGSGERNLTSNVSNALVPIYAPDGRRVAYLSLGSGRFLVMPAEGGAATDLGSGPDGYAWAPDGTALVVGHGALQVIDATTGGVRANIPTGDQSFPGHTHFPSWQPVTQ